jgi:hypothetical protein
MRGVCWHNDEISGSTCYIKLLDKLMVGKQVKLSHRLTMHHEGNMCVCVGNGVMLHNLGVGN